MLKELNLGEVSFPKRRKAKNNPYKISYSNNKKSYTITFKDGVGVTHTLMINQALYYAFNQFELDDLKMMNEYDRHTEHSELSEVALYTRALQQPQEVIDLVASKIRDEELESAISKLSSIQRSRLVRYYFYGLTYEEIASQDSCSYQAVARTIEAAKKNLKNWLVQVEE